MPHPTLDCYGARACTSIVPHFCRSLNNFNHSTMFVLLALREKNSAAKPSIYYSQTLPATANSRSQALFSETSNTHQYPGQRWGVQRVHDMTFCPTLEVTFCAWTGTIDTCRGRLRTRHATTLTHVGRVRRQFRSPLVPRHINYTNTNTYTYLPNNRT